MKPIYLLAATATLCTLATAPVSAQITEGSIIGTVTQLTTNLSGVAVGDAVTGTYSYNASVVVGGVFGDHNPFTSFSLFIGHNPRIFTLTDLLPFDNGRYPNSSSGSVDYILNFFNFNTLSSFLGEPVVQQSGSSFSGPPPETYSASRTISGSDVILAYNFIATPVPEPGHCALLLGLSVSGVAFARRRLRRR